MRTSNWRYMILAALLTPALLVTACNERPSAEEVPTASDPAGLSAGETPISPQPSPLLVESFIQRV